MKIRYLLEDACYWIIGIFSRYIGIMATIIAITFFAAMITLAILIILGGR